MNEAKQNSTAPLPPINFLTLDTFRHMKQFEVEALDPKWCSFLKAELERRGDLKEMISNPFYKNNLYHVCQKKHGQIF